MGHYYFTHTASPTLLSSKTCCVAPRGWPETRRRVHVRDHGRALSARLSASIATGVAVERTKTSYERRGVTPAARPGPCTRLDTSCQPYAARRGACPV